MAALTTASDTGKRPDFTAAETALAALPVDVRENLLAEAVSFLHESFALAPDSLAA